MSDKKIKIEPAKGRPMLNWVGKKPLDYIKSFPAQLVEVFDPSGKAERIENPTFAKLENNWQNMLFHGDNKEVLSYLIANGFRGKIDLVYIDPPFNTGVPYVRKIVLRNIKEQTEKISGNEYTLPEQLQYYYNISDDSFLQFLHDRMQLLKELMSINGVIFIRIDVHYGHYLKIIADEIWGRDCFINEIVVNRIRKNVTGQGKLSLPNAVDHLYVYSNNPDFGYVNIDKVLVHKKDGYWRAMDSSEVRPNPVRIIENKEFYPPAGRHFTFTQENVNEMYENGKIRINPESNKPEYWVEEREKISLDTNWCDVSGYTFSTGYPTENSLSLLERVITVASKPNDIVLDCFMGSGTTQTAAQKLGRRWIGCDINKGSIQTTSKRLQTNVKGQLNNGNQKTLAEENKPYNTFSVYKVNDFDLQILRTEAIELAVEHIGIQRTKTDAFFEGMLGKNLVKIIDFNHPLTMLDLQLLQDELKKRPDENRNVTIVCLGKELSVDPWIEDYNKKHPVNKLEIIELRTDTKYGKFLIHKPIAAKIDIKRKSNKALIEIKDFISPSIIERLNTNETMFKVKITDFRSMIDVVLIDANYDGKVFNIVHSDVPEKKNDFVAGNYELDIPKDKVKVAVKIIDMLGEEMIEVKEI